MPPNPSEPTSESVPSDAGRRLPGFLLPLDDRLFVRRRRQYPDALARVLTGADSVLDVGCGGSAFLLREVPTLKGYVGVDAIPVQLPETAPGDARTEQMDVRTIAERFEPGSFDVVVALDVIEHLSKDEGWALLDAMERLARRRVIVFTPNGFLEQGAVDGNPYQVHRSGWSVGEFRARGYRIRGINGFKPLRGGMAEVRWRPVAVWERVTRLTQGLFVRRPRWAFQLLCVRDRLSE